MGRPRSRRWVIRTLLLIAVATVAYWRLAPRPAFLPLTTSIDGPAPAHATGVVVFLHGRGGTLARAKEMAARLRAAGLPPDYAIVLVEGPYGGWAGHHWGDTPEEQAATRARLRSLLDALFAEATPPRERVTIAGFSQGAGVAIDMAVAEARIGAVASFSPCLSMLRGELPKHDDVRVLLAHGTADTRCPVEESRSLARVLAAAKRPAEYIEFDGPHTVPPEVVRALVAFATSR
jgi:phospholipase/carboxylesterase